MVKDINKMYWAGILNIVAQLTIAVIIKLIDL